MDLDGKVALVSGGASGIGLATARRLGQGGCRVVLADIDVDRGSAAAREIGGRFVELDVAESTVWEAAVAELLDDEGRLDVAHLNAGVGLGVADITEVGDEAYRHIMAVNLDGVVFGTRAVVPAMLEGGAIVATASLGGLTPMPADPLYSATKHAVVAFIRSVAPTLARRGITANAVCPGFADTALMTDELRAKVAVSGLPLVEPDAVARAVLAILAGGGTADAWFVQPGRDAAPYTFRGVPGPGPRANQ